MHNPTYVPRRQGYAGAKIDGMFGARCRMGVLQIRKDSRHELATDHERAAAYLTREEGQGMEGCVGGVLASLARAHTKPAFLGPKFSMSVATRRLRDVAK